jgi:hypothetical protein
MADDVVCNRSFIVFIGAQNIEPVRIDCANIDSCSEYQNIYCQNRNFLNFRMVRIK